VSACDSDVEIVAGNYEYSKVLLWEKSDTAGRTVVKGSRYGEAIHRQTLQEFSEKCRHDCGPESEAHEHSGLTKGSPPEPS
jgi:hypothetical protein